VIGHDHGATKTGETGQIENGLRERRYLVVADARGRGRVSREKLGHAVPGP
jgi:hypothetical protein